MYFDGSLRLVGSTDLDAISVVGGQLYFSTDTNTNPNRVGGTADDSDIYRWNGGSELHPGRRRHHRRDPGRRQRRRLRVALGDGLPVLVRCRHHGHRPGCRPGRGHRAPHRQHVVRLLRRHRAQASPTPASTSTRSTSRDPVGRRHPRRRPPERSTATMSNTTLSTDSPSTDGSRPTPSPHHGPRPCPRCAGGAGNPDGCWCSCSSSRSA